MLGPTALSTVSALDLVDKVLGWREAEHARDMQLHYEESSVQKRFLEALVTWDV